MTTISPSAAPRLANPRCRICKGIGTTGRTDDGLFIACSCVVRTALHKTRKPRRNKSLKSRISNLKFPHVVQPETRRHD